MRTGIHPEYVESRVTCSCGNTFLTRSTKSELHIELCNKCHPFYTGQQKFVDTGGRVQRFSDKFGGAADSVMARAIAEKKKRQEAHEAAEAQAREARAVKAAAEAERASKMAKAKPAEDVAEAADETPIDAVDESPVEAVDEAAADAAVEEAVEAPAEETAEAAE